jgi:predicted phage-related endonuclease
VRRESWDISSRGEWLERRRGHVTGSRVGVLWGVHPYATRDRLATELRGGSTKGDTPSLRRGRVLEAAVIEALREEHPEAVIERCRSYHWLPEHRIGATPDAWLDDDGLIECKTVRPEVWERWHGHPPLAYVLQLLVGLMCTGRRHGILACMVLSPDYPVHEFAVERHPEAEQRILDAVGAWWDAWDRGEIAAPVDAAGIEALLDDGTHLNWSDNAEMRTLLEERRDLKAEISRLTQRLGEYEYRLKNNMGSASTAWLPGWSLTFARRERREYTVPAALVRTLRIKEIVYE